MQMAIMARLAMAAGALALMATQGLAHGTAGAHEHDDDAIYRGYFDDNQIEARPLSDWAGDWQSVYPYLTDGTLDPVMADKAEHGDKSAAEYRAYYQTGYQTEIDRIVIDGDHVAFHGPDGAAEGHYASDGYEVLTYAKGNRGVRYVFRKTDGDAAAPQFIQFSDHAIAPVKAGHYHLYFGNDRAGLLAEVTNWPTYYPSSLTGDQIVHEMIAH